MCLRLLCPRHGMWLTTPLRHCGGRCVYPLLLSQALKFAGEGSSLHARLTEALVSMERTIAMVNDDVRREADRQRTMEVLLKCGEVGAYLMSAERMLMLEMVAELRLAPRLRAPSPPSRSSSPLLTTRTMTFSQRVAAEVSVALSFVRRKSPPGRRGRAPGAEHSGRSDNARPGGSREQLSNRSTERGRVSEQSDKSDIATGREHKRDGGEGAALPPISKGDRGDAPVRARRGRRSSISAAVAKMGDYVLEAAAAVGPIDAWRVRRRYRFLLFSDQLLVCRTTQGWLGRPQALRPKLLMAINDIQLWRCSSAAGDEGAASAGAGWSAARVDRGSSLIDEAAPLQTSNAVDDSAHVSGVATAERLTDSVDDDDGYFSGRFRLRWHGSSAELVDGTHSEVTQLLVPAVLGGAEANSGLVGTSVVEYDGWADSASDCAEFTSKVQQQQQALLQQQQEQALQIAKSSSLLGSEAEPSKPAPEMLQALTPRRTSSRSSTGRWLSYSQRRSRAQENGLTQQATQLHSASPNDPKRRLGLRSKAGRVARGLYGRLVRKRKPQQAQQR